MLFDAAVDMLVIVEIQTSRNIASQVMSVSAFKKREKHFLKSHMLQSHDGQKGMEIYSQTKKMTLDKF